MIYLEWLHDKPKWQPFDCTKSLSPENSLGKMRNASSVRLRRSELGFGELAGKHMKLHCTRVMGRICSLCSKSGLQHSESILFYKFEPHLQLSCQWYSRQNDSRSSKVREVQYFVAIHWFLKLQRNTDCKRSWYQHSVFVSDLSSFNDILSTP